MWNRFARKKTILLLVFATSFYQISFAQQNKIDSLIKVLKIAKDDTSKVNTLNALSEQFWQIAKYAEGKKYAEDALLLAEKTSFKKGIANAYNTIGNIYLSQSNYPEAVKNYFASLKIREDIGDKEGIADSYSGIGVIYMYKSNYPEALKNHLASLKIKEEIGDKKGIAASYSNIGIIYAEQGNYSEALRNHLASLKINEEIGNKQGIAQSYNNIGIIYIYQGNYPEALKNNFASLKISEETGNKQGIADSYGNIGNIYISQANYPEALKNYLLSLKIFVETGDKKGIGSSYINIGDIYYYQANYPEALKNFFACLKISEETGDKQGIADSYINIGDIYNDQGNYAEALKNHLASLKINEEIGDKKGIANSNNHTGKTYTALKKFSKANRFLNDGLSLSKEIGSKDDIRDSYRNLAELDSASGNWAGAYQNHKLFILYRDSLVNEESSKKIVQYQMQYEFDKKEDSLKYAMTTLDKEKTIQTLETKKQKQAKNYFIAGLALFAILSFFVYKNYRTRQKLKLQALRIKIASDLHDDVGSTLSSISIFSQMAQEQSKEVLPLLQSIDESTREMLDAMADIVWTINPGNDQFEKIILRMRSFAYELLGAKKIEFRFVADSNIANIRLSMEARRNLYLIFKEATNNMVKYAEASKAIFSIKGEQGKLVMRIKDNGKGFDSNKETQGNGLKNMRKRASEMGAVLMIDSMPGSGTTIKLEMAV